MKKEIKKKERERERAGEKKEMESPRGKLSM